MIEKREKAVMAMKPTLAVHKFSSCDGCQLSLLNLGEDLPRVAELVDIVHFIEAGPTAPEAPVDIALVEGSVSTPEERTRIQQVREHSGFVIAMGACAVSGGLQALRNLADAEVWKRAVYASPQYIEQLATATPASAHIKVDFEIWGCPVNSRQVVGALRDLLSGVRPRPQLDKVCMSCKRQGLDCVMVSAGEPCLGPVTQDGCGALCPALGRGCYGCYGPAASVNTDALAGRFGELGLDAAGVARRFGQINSQAPAFGAAAAKARGQGHD